MPYFDNPYQASSNLHTANYVNDIAASEGLDVIARLGNPTGAGLHAKLHLLAVGAERWVVIASMNGSEASNKLNREMGLTLQSAQAYDYLKTIFAADWGAAPHHPGRMSSRRTPLPARRLSRAAAIRFRNRESFSKR